MMLFATAAGYMAMPALAALLLITAWRMSEPHRWREYMSAPISDRLLLLTTLVLTVLVDLTVAIGVGVSVGRGVVSARQLASVTFVTSA